MCQPQFPKYNGLPASQTLQVPNMMSDSPYAFDAPDADVILRAPLKRESTKLKDFRVHKAILSVASTFFSDMFSIPQPPQHAKGDTTLPIVQVAESAEVFEIFLRLIYPIEPPVINSLQSVDNLFQLAEKYMASGVRAKLKQILLSPSFLNDDPILVYAIACRTNLHGEAKLVIPHTFKIDLVQDIPQSKFRMMTIDSYHRLLVEHSLRRGRLVNAVDEVYRSRAIQTCLCREKLKKEVRLQISGKPFLDGPTLEKCVASALESKNSNKWGCPLSREEHSTFITDIVRRINEM